MYMYLFVFISILMFVRFHSNVFVHPEWVEDNTLQKMIAAHERAISAICWCPEDEGLASSWATKGPGGFRSRFSSDIRV